MLQPESRSWSKAETSSGSDRLADLGSIEIAGIGSEAWQVAGEGGAESVEEGERRLVRAILEDAIHCYTRYLLARDAYRRRLHTEADLWIMRGAGTDSKDDLSFSFHYVCEILNLDPGYVRLGLKRWRERQLIKEGERRAA